ncbi:TraR/DksA C4-type zinc finger protein [Metabacillus fastidiosus]|uniref:TraR/DksA C4-type zinc finger protein n=1 Tax=Metabacillus fastidiosus TaxID=1458 RepID=UPI003D2C8AB1
MVSKQDLIHFERKLLEKKQEIINMIETNEKSLREDYGELTAYDNHFADTATELDEREKEMMLNDNAKDLLEDVEEALERIKKGTYGICIDTGEEIPYSRLEVLPYAKRTLKAQEEFESGTVIQEEDKSFLTPPDDKRGDKRIDIADELQYEHGNSSY